MNAKWAWPKIFLRTLCALLFLMPPKLQHLLTPMIWRYRSVAKSICRIPTSLFTNQVTTHRYSFKCKNCSKQEVTVPQVHIQTLHKQHYSNTILISVPSNKHKKQLNEIDGRSRDGSAKKYSNKGSRLGIIRYILHPYQWRI